MGHSLQSLACVDLKLLNMELQGGQGQMADLTHPSTLAVSPCLVKKVSYIGEGELDIDL